MTLTPQKQFFGKLSIDTMPSLIFHFDGPMGAGICTYSSFIWQFAILLLSYLRERTSVLLACLPTVDMSRESAVNRTAVAHALDPLLLRHQGSLDILSP